ncbi:hypothetical protein KA005_30330, partial [bacterium]|nr:hypothetical protein [bacterium]
MSSNQSNNIQPFFYFIKKFYGLIGILSCIPGVFPFVANFAKWEKARLVPPLDYDFLVIYALLLIFVLPVTYCLRYLRFFRDFPSVTTLMIIFLFLLACTSTLVYIDWQERVIRCGIAQPEKASPETYCVIIGLELKKSKKDRFSSYTPDQILDNRGYKKEQVREFWTSDSIRKARRWVIGSYLSIPIFFVAAISVLLIRTCIDDQWRNKHEKSKRG